MIDIKQFNKVRNILVILIFIFFVTSFIVATESAMNPSDLFAKIFALSSALMGVLLYGLGSIYLLKNKEKIKLRKVLIIGFRVSLILLLPGVLLLYLLETMIIVIISAIGILIFAPFVLYIIHDNRLALINLLLLAGFFIGFIFKRLHFPFSSVILGLFCALIAAGMVIYFFNCLFTITNNRYLRLTSTTASVLIALGYLSFLFKYNHWPGANLLISSFYLPMVVLTIIVLLTLPRSGFISWKKRQKDVITKKLIVLWLFLLLMGSLRYILPTATFNAVFIDEVRQYHEFDMRDYEPALKNGLELEIKK